eukprot:CAMPEP_0182480014 /NCGR_PEP_ID=MMETSP1319-20130603/35132_1 /TAXON_ID=172717 /ORGANISM="Bolidomonas pacifica, Strain RCC208" /LENGTH=123 /DNA_ID=CAMNT_0024681473 /DNA_START=225 /DNA_END=596 /DNA_ORIENTATION=+
MRIHHPAKVAVIEERLHGHDALLFLLLLSLLHEEDVTQERTQETQHDHEEEEEAPTNFDDDFMLLVEASVHASKAGGELIGIVVFQDLLYEGLGCPIRMGTQLCRKGPKLHEQLRGARIQGVL